MTTSRHARRGSAVAFAPATPLPLLLLLLLLALAGCEEPRPPQPQATGNSAVEITMTDRLTYNPATVTVRAGETVRWRNTSSLVHTVTADAQQAQNPQHVQLPQGAEPFDSGHLAPGNTFEHTFEVPGTYRYFCVPHEADGMIGEIQVEPAE